MRAVRALRGCGLGNSRNHLPLAYAIEWSATCAPVIAIGYGAAASSLRFMNAAPRFGVAREITHRSQRPRIGRRPVRAHSGRAQGSHCDDGLPLTGRLYLPTGMQAPEDRLITPLDTPWPRDARYLQIGDLLIDLRYRQVLDAGNEVVLPQRIFDLLLLLMAEPHALHSRTELFDRLWPGLVVEDANLSQSVWLLRRALGDARKTWIRTVAGAGYVFEPPGPVEAFIDRPDSAVASTPAEQTGDAEKASASTLTTPEPTVLPARRPGAFGWLRSWRGWSVAAALLASLTIAWAVWNERRPDPHAPAAVVPLTVALVEVEDSATGVHWPVALLHDWLGWKLHSLPEMTLLTEAELAADKSAALPTVIFISSGTDPQNPSEVVLRARFQQPAGEQRIEVRGGIDEVPGMVDALSREVIKRLSPGRAGPWPPLRLDTHAARRYADLAAAMKHRDWIAAARLSDEIVKLAPRFGLARLQQAQARSALSQAPEAVASMTKAIALLQPAPADAIALLEAQRMAMDLEPQSQRKAVEAYAALTARYPGNAAIALEYATLLLQTVNIDKALKVLAPPTWDRESTGIRIQRLLVLSRAYRAQGDPQRALQIAQEAERLARAAGKDWTLERGAAMLQAALLDPGPDQQPRIALFEQAAHLLDEGGNRTAALYARFQAELAGGPTPGKTQRLNALLSQARAGGYRSLELLILMVAADRAHQVGDIDLYRDYLIKALAVGETSGDTGRRNILELVVVYEDLMALRYASAQKRIDRLNREDPQGHVNALTRRLDAALAASRGEHTRARNILVEGERQLARFQPDPERASQAQSELACAKIESDLALGDLTAARSDGRRCASSTHPNTSAHARLLDAYIQLLAGDMAAAREVLTNARTAVRALPDGPDRWSHATMLASLLTRTGDIAESDRLYADILSKQRHWGYVLLIAQAETGLAENAAARDDWSKALRHVNAARRELPADDWSLRYRLDVIDAAAALATGDTARATSIAARTHSQAHRLGDTVAQMELHELMPLHAFPECTRASQEALVARSGLRGATLDWLQSERSPEFTVSP